MDHHCLDKVFYRQKSTENQKERHLRLAKHFIPYTLIGLGLLVSNALMLVILNASVKLIIKFIISNREFSTNYSTTI